MFGPALNSPFSNKKNDPYNKLKNNARIYLNKYFARTNNKATINNANRNILRNIKAFAESNPRQAAVAGAAAAAASPAAQPAVTAALLTPTPNSAQSNAANAGNAGGAQPAVAAAVETARQNGNNTGAAAGAAAAANSNNAKSALKAINWSSLSNADRNDAINRLLSQFGNKFNGMTNNGLNNNYQRSILVTIKTKRPPALPPKPVAAPASGNLINLSGNSAPPPPPAGGPVPSNGPATMFGLEWTNNANKRRNIYAKNMGSKIYYAKKNGSNTNYYRVINGASGKKIFDPNNKSVYLWNKNSMNFVKKVGGAGNNNLGLSGLVQQAASNVRSQSGSNRGSSVASGNLGNVSSGGENSNIEEIQGGRRNNKYGNNKRTNATRAMNTAALAQQIGYSRNMNARSPSAIAEALSRLKNNSISNANKVALVASLSRARNNYGVSNLVIPPVAKKN
jgi:hypothetical protein